MASAGMLALAGCTRAAQAPVWPRDRPSPTYDYPFNNPWLATVAGTPQAQRTIFPTNAMPQRRRLTLFPDRNIPEGFWYYSGLDYSVLLQPVPAPLVFVIGGTGADDQSPLMVFMARLAHAAGAHAVLIPSPTHANFIVTASTDFLPANGQRDADDLLRVMHAVIDEITPQVGITRFGLTGYSLGAWHAAFVAEEDARRPDRIGFERVLLMNPPLSLYRSLRQIDEMLYRGLPEGVDGLSALLDRVVARLGEVYRSTEALDFGNQDLLIALYENMRPNDESMATVVGLAFRLTSTNMIFTADVMGRNGFVFPADKPFRSTTPLGQYLAVTLRLSLQDYFNEMYLGHPANGGLNAQELIWRSSLDSIGGWLSQQQGIGLVTAQDDIILAPGDLAGLEKIFAGRAKVYPNGGHLGNLMHRSVADHIVRFFQG